MWKQENELWVSEGVYKKQEVKKVCMLSLFVLCVGRYIKKNQLSSGRGGRINPHPATKQYLSSYEEEEEEEEKKKKSKEVDLLLSVRHPWREMSIEPSNISAPPSPRGFAYSRHCPHIKINLMSKVSSIVSSALFWAIHLLYIYIYIYI